MASIADILSRVPTKAMRLWFEEFLKTWFSRDPLAGASPLGLSTGKIDSSWISQGSGSGLDADKLDGHESAYFQTALANAANIVYLNTNNVWAATTQNVFTSAELLGVPVKASSDGSVQSQGNIYYRVDVAELRYYDGANARSVESTFRKDAASGYCGLDSSSKVAKSKISTTGAFVNADLPTKTFFGDQDNTLDSGKKLDASAGNLIIPSVSSDPSSPVEGQLWFRSDTLQMSIRSGGATLRRAFA